MTSADDFVLQLMEEKGLVSADIISQCREELLSQGTTSADVDSKLIDLLVERKYCKYDDISFMLANEFNVPFISLQNLTVDDDVKNLISQKDARKYNVFPIAITGGQLELAVIDPMDMDVVDNLGHMLKMPIDIRIATPADIKSAIDEHYGVNAYGDILGTEGAEVSEEIKGLETGNEAGVSEEEAPIIRYVHKLITEAVKRRASDIHLEPLEKRFRIRYRIDGVLIEVENPPKRLQPSIISRLKLMANISIAEKRVPQDGRIQIVYNKKEIDLRRIEPPDGLRRKYRHAYSRQGGAEARSSRTRLLLRRPGGFRKNSRHGGRHFPCYRAYGFG